MTSPVTGIARSWLRPVREDLRIALVAPRNMRFSPVQATSIDLHIHETALWSRFRAQITVFAEEVDAPFDDVAVRFWPRGQAKRHIERLLAEARPDLIVAHQHLPTAARLAARFPDVPVALVRHNFQNAPRNMISAYLKRQSFNRLSAIAFVSQQCRDRFARDWPGLRVPVHVTPNGVDSRLWHCARPKRRTILFCGRMVPEKGVLEAAEAVAQVLAARLGWNAVFVLASAPDQDDYASRVRAVLDRLGDRVEVVEDASHAEVRARMACSMIAVAPTLGEESFGRVAIEAMASGAVIVASRASGFVEVIGTAGVLLDAPEAGLLRDAVLALIDAPDRLSALAEAGRRRVEDRYDLARSVDAFDRMAGTLLAGALPEAALDGADAVG